MAAPDLPVLIVGDVHGDIRRLFKALKPHPPDRCRTVFVGDLVDYGSFGVGVLRYARDRPNTEVLLGNHEVAMLWALRDPSRIGWWIAVGGQEHDLAELRRDEALQRWMRERPALLDLADGTVVQHCGNDAYLELGRDVAAINAAAAEQLRTGGERLLWDLFSSPNVFEAQPERLDRYLESMHSRRVAFGHKPERGRKPLAFHGGRGLNFEGAVAPLPD
jgi:Calcineurin-like phosphoesterase